MTYPWVNLLIGVSWYFRHFFKLFEMRKEIKGIFFLHFQSTAYDNETLKIKTNVTIEKFMNDIV